ncbi:hypothetical protein [Nonomuraea cavernae]|nr:hypothetical protein [Nonomuraea cavernae]MCA2183664.1 hypothetical protein [Nonomuraea cavernae]
MGLLFRAIIVVSSLFALLPDSAIIQFPFYAQTYGLATTLAGLAGAACFLLVRNLKLAETLRLLDESITYLQDQSVRLLTLDGLSRQVAGIEIRKEIRRRDSTLQRSALDGLENLPGITPPQNGP